MNYQKLPKIPLQSTRAPSKVRPPPPMLPFVNNPTPGKCPFDRAFDCVFSVSPNRSVPPPSIHPFFPSRSLCIISQNQFIDPTGITTLIIRHLHDSVVECICHFHRLRKASVLKTMKICVAIPAKSQNPSRRSSSLTIRNNTPFFCTVVTMKETLSSYTAKANQGPDVLLTTRHHWLFLLFKMTRWSPFFDQLFPRQHRIDPRVVVVNPPVSIFHPNEDESELWWYSNRLKRIQTRCPYIVLFHCSPVLLFFQLLMHAHFSNGRRQDHNVWACTIDRICRMFRGFIRPKRNRHVSLSTHFRNSISPSVVLSLLRPMNC